MPRPSSTKPQDGDCRLSAWAKVVVFSQWRRTHELIIRRLEARGWGYVLFHGGVPGERRGELVDRFHQDPACRVFLSTDAGGVGLNLQHAASTVINMDLPWNPAVLEQRIGRVFRLGQTRSVQVVNFIAEGTIEEGMLSVLSFKRSLFEGVLDGGESEISLHGTRLARFMESVEEVTGHMGEPAAEAEEDADAVAAEVAAGEASGEVAELPGEAPVEAAARPPREAAPEQRGPAAAATEPAATASADPWAGLLDAGLKLVESLAAAGREGAAGAPPSPWVETDAATGKSYLKLPVPEPETVRRLADALGGLLAGLRGK